MCNLGGWIALGGPRAQKLDRAKMYVDVSLNLLPPLWLQYAYQRHHPPSTPLSAKRWLFYRGRI